jgi:hypothetical protein
MSAANPPESQPAATLQTDVEPVAAPADEAMSPPPRWGAVVHWAALAVAAVSVVVIVSEVYHLASGVHRIEIGQLDRDLLPLLLGMIGLGLGGSVFALRPELGETDRLVATAAVWSAVFLVALTLLWILIQQSERQRLWVGQPITSQAELDSYLESHLANWTPGSPKPVLLPTGVMIQSIEFLNANNVTVSGYVWQKVGPDVPKDITPGVVFPEAVRDAYDQSEVYRYREGDTEVIGWYFAATLRQPFDYSKYPFDRQNIWLRMWSRDFSRGALLVPDFASYYDTVPTAMPGIENNFVYNGWTPIYSGFSYALNAYDSSFGLPRGPAATRFPELYFNFVLKRSFLGPFTDYILFGLAASLLLFGILTLTTSNEMLKTRFGLSTAGVVTAVSGLFFAIILKHNQLRTTLGTPATAYLEALPYILYLLLILVGLNAILLSSPYNIRFVEYRQNLLPKLLFWPILFALLLLVTINVFF